MIQSDIVVEECLPLRMLPVAKRLHTAATQPSHSSPTHRAAPPEDLDMSREYSFDPTWDPQRNLYCVNRKSPLHEHHFENGVQVSYMHIENVYVHHVTMEASLIKKNTHDTDFLLPQEYITIHQGNFSMHQVPHIHFCWNTTIQQMIKDNTNKDHYFALTYTVTNATSRYQLDELNADQASDAQESLVDDDYRSVASSQLNHHANKELTTPSSAVTLQSDDHDTVTQIQDDAVRVAYLDVRGWENPPTTLKWRFYAPNACDFEGFDETAKSAHSGDTSSQEDHKKVGLTHGFEHAGFIEWTDMKFNQSRESYRITWTYGAACNFSFFWYLLTIVLVFFVMSLVSCLLCFLLTIAQNVFRNKDYRELKYYQLDNNMRKPAVPIVKAPILEQLKL